MGPPGLNVSKLYACSGENPLIYIENVQCCNVHCCGDLERGQTDLVDVSCTDEYKYNDKNLSNPKMTVCFTFKSYHCQNFLWSCCKKGQGQNYDMR